MNKIKKSHVLVVGAGPNLKKYWDKIKKFIDKEKPLVFGCNYITNFLIPDYHFWGSAKRWRVYGHFVDKKSILIFSQHFPKYVIREKWKGKYKVFKNVERTWKIGSENTKTKEHKGCKVYYKNKKMFGCVRDIATWAIFYAYIKGASKISVVGNDGYTLYSKKKLDDKKESQNCHGEGLTSGYSYDYCRRNDWFKYRTLKLLHKYGKEKYGFGFEMITPTVFDKFYNSDILGIENNPDWQKWKEPSEKEYKNLYVGSLKDKKPNDFVDKWA